MIVVVNLFNPPQSIVHSGVRRTFIDAEFFCVDETDGLYKYKQDNIWLIVEKEESNERGEVKEAAE